MKTKINDRRWADLRGPVACENEPNEKQKSCNFRRRKKSVAHRRSRAPIFATWSLHCCDKSESLETDDSYSRERKTLLTLANSLYKAATAKLNVASQRRRSGHGDAVCAAGRVDEQAPVCVGRSVKLFLPTERKPVLARIREPGRRGRVARGSERASFDLDRRRRRRRPGASGPRYHDSGDSRSRDDTTTGPTRCVTDGHRNLPRDRSSKYNDKDGGARQRTRDHISSRGRSRGA